MLKILSPSKNNKPYWHAADEFRNLYKKITGLELGIITVDDGQSDLVVIGSDSVNVFCHQLIMKQVIPEFKLRHDTDDYQILSADYEGRKLLFLAGGRGRSTFYAVYDFFERRGGCRYFWDGDIIPKSDSIDLDGLDITESPRFEYRGLRYFAHRSLHRFQAEMWDLPEWRREIDWLLKKRLNMFMLRIGLDDLFQKTFPEIVNYPSPEGKLPEAIDGSYDDRSLFWSLEYRGKLRKDLLQYAFERDLMHPEDIGTMTHWYSRTPKEFLDKINPDFMPQATKSYSEETGLVWDIRQDKNLDNYFKITQAHIKHYGRPDLFHTIGLAERMCSHSRWENQQFKLFTYRRIIGKLREHYPNAPLLIASWDFLFYWQPKEVRELLKELNPNNTIIFDYTSDTFDEVNNFRNWGVVGEFPWIFGIFHAYEADTDIRGNYKEISRRLQIAKDDPMCKGMVFWPENSHCDIMMLEYFTQNSWQPLVLSEEEMLVKFCQDRYGEMQAQMRDLWSDFIPLATADYWRLNMQNIKRALDRKLIFNLLMYNLVADIDTEYFLKAFEPVIDSAPELFRRLSQLQIPSIDSFVYRDCMDIARTLAGRVLFYGLIKLSSAMEEWRLNQSEKSEESIAVLSEWYPKMLAALRDLLALSEDFSLNDSLQKLKREHVVNPYFEERTLKGNAGHLYCRNYIYELFDGIYLSEAKVYLDFIQSKIEDSDRLPWEIPAYFKDKRNAILQDFLATPLAQMAPKARRHVGAFHMAVRRLAKLASEICI
jgi:hypothetical protein